MRVLLCNERFLFRFGADRVLILLGQGLTQLGHTVSVIANRFDRCVVERFASRIVDLPGPPGRYFHLNEDTAEWLSLNWATLFDESSRPDVVFVGGWPFFAAIPFLRTVCPQVIFIDFGAVPWDGYEGGALLIQQKLRQLRAQFLPHSTRIVAISDFILHSQSLPDSAGSVPAETILLGADHVEAGLWTAGQVSGAASEGRCVAKLDCLKTDGRPVILSLGRWEPGCYKNSEQAFELLRGVRARIPGAALAILAETGLNLPADLQDAVVPIGFPCDAELLEVMRRADLGVSLSRWEGFNLPVAEMQWLARPALAFDLAAHPEVILHPWFLCLDLPEMIEKSVAILTGRVPVDATDPEAIKPFRENFQWNRMVNQYHQLLLGSSDKRIHLIVDVTNSTRDPANSGVIRVTRRFCRELQNREDPLFVIWDDQAGCYVLPTREEFAQLGQFNGPLLTSGLTSEQRLSPSTAMRVRLDEALERSGCREPWIIFSETMMEVRFKSIRVYVRALKLRTAAIFYDAIPVLRPDLCNDETRNNHRNYMIGLAECDVAVPISNYSGQCLKEFWQAEQIAGCPIRVNVLPGEFGGSRREIVSPPDSPQVQILCVSTLEPRKNHRRLVEACLRLEQTHPEVDWTLTLAGNKYAGAFEIADWIEEAGRRNSRVRWLGIVDDASLHRLYGEATFTVYPSIIEGFGLPILESVWHGCPCICSQSGVMGELAQEGGCLTTDVQDVNALSEAIATLARNHELRRKLAQQALQRKLKTWRDYVDEFRSLLPRAANFDRPMPNGERFALMGLLASQQPRCSVALGPCSDASLSLIAQHSGMVFSVDADPPSGSRAGHLPEVTFLTGKSSGILPLLFRELSAAGLSVDFILVDGSAGEAERDFGLVLQYVPSKPLYVVIQNSSGRSCHQALMDILWHESPYCHWVDLDFVPGQLAVAYLQPTPRKGNLPMSRSAAIL